MKLESMAYSFCGNNLLIGSHIRKQLAFLKEIVPPDLKQKRVDDLGCGDGKITVLLEKIFQPRKLRGFDINPGLVKRARRRGIDAEVGDLDGNMPSGELAIMWGVLHHLRDCNGCLQRLKRNYPLIFIREPVRTSIIKGLELGHPLKPEEITYLIKRHLPDSKIFYCERSILVFYARPDYINRKEDYLIPVKSLSHNIYRDISSSIPDTTL